MPSRLPFYKFSFIINIISCIFFAGLLIYNVLTRLAKVGEKDSLGIILLFIFTTIYLLTDFAGLDLIKKLKHTENLSRRRVTWIGIGIFLQLVIESLLAIGIFYGINNIRTLPGEFPVKVYVNLLSYYAVMVIIFLTSAYNIFAILKLIKKVRINQVEFEQIIEDIGTNP
ncbi:hypothetical protein BH11BAC4_BH11BAC4_07890 [soil metagenome]